MGENLTVEIAYKALQNFMRQKPFVLLGSGTSCAVDSRLGMTALRDYLVGAIPGKELNPAELSQWNAVAGSLANGIDLESAMNAIQDEGLTQKIVDSTADFVASLDLEYSVKILSGQTVWPTILLFKHIVEGLPIDYHSIRIGSGIDNPFQYLFHLRYQLCLFDEKRQAEKVRLIALFSDAIRKKSRISPKLLMGQP